MPTIEMIIAGALLISLTIYVLSGGADFGAGVWDILASGPRKQDQRDLIVRAIGPIWEANHVWLILVVVMSFFAFSKAFALMMTALNIPLTLMLIGIVLRGSAFTFRNFDHSHSWLQARWGRLFASASIVTPVVLGMCVGAIASGGVGRASHLDSYWYLTAWCSPFSFVLGLFTLSLFAFLAGVYLCVQADNSLLKDDFRIRSLCAATVTAILGFSALFLVDRDVPSLRTGLLGKWTSNFFMALTVLIALIAVLALWRRSYRIARFFATAQVTLILWGWAASQYPLLVPPDMTLSMAAAPPNLLRSLLAALIAGLIILVPSLWYLYRVFELPARAPRADSDMR